MKDLEIYNPKLNPLQKELVREYEEIIIQLAQCDERGIWINKIPLYKREGELKQQLGLEERQ